MFHRFLLQNFMMFLLILSLQVKNKVRSEIPDLVLAQCGYWLPANAVNFMLLGKHDMKQLEAS